MDWVVIMRSSVCGAAPWRKVAVASLRGHVTACAGRVVPCLLDASRVDGFQDYRGRLPTTE